MTDKIPEVIALIEGETDDEGKGQECEHLFRVPDGDSEAFDWLLNTLHDIVDKGLTTADLAEGALRFIKALVDHDNRLHVELDRLEGELVKQSFASARARGN